MDNRLPTGLRGRVIFGKGMRMTIKQAAMWLCQPGIVSMIHDPTTKKALSVAVKALAKPELGANLAEVGTDCISRQQAINIAKDLTITVEGYEMHNQAVMNYCADIMQLPPIQPEIMRCKDCKHWIPYDWMFSEMWQSKNIADYPEEDIGCAWCDMAMKANDFCSRGERKIDGQSC